MKNNLFKKLISFVLTLAVCCFTFAVYVAEASTIVVYNEDYEKSGEILKSLCPDLPLNSGELTTRAEFTASVVMVLGLATSGEVQTGFNDVPSTHQYASYIKAASDMGLISNVELFYPDSPITYAQAVKIVMSAAGYGKKAELTGGFPTGYLTEARKAGIDLGLGNDDTLSHKISAQLIFEASVIDIMEASSFGSSYEYTTSAGKNVLSVYRNVFMACGVVSANQYTGLRSISSSAPENSIIVDGISYAYAEGDDLLGKKVRLFYNDDNKNSVIYAYECDNVSYSYASGSAIKISGSQLLASPQNSMKEEKHNLEADFTVIYNGKCYNAADYVNYLNPQSGSVMLIDNNNNGKIDVIVIKEVVYGVISGMNYDEEKIYDKFVSNSAKNLGNSDVKYSIREDDGTPLELTGLESGDAVGYIVSKDNKLMEIIRYNNRVGGELEYITSDNKIALGGNEYELSEYYSSNVKSVSEIKIGREYILHIGEGNTVIYIQEFTTSMTYGFLVAAGSNSGLDGRIMAKIFGADGTMYELPLAKKLILDGRSVSDADALPVLDATEQKDVILRVVKYSVNAKGEISKIYQTVENTAGTKAFLTRAQDEASPVLYDDNSKHGYVEVSSASKGKLVLKNDVFYPYFYLAPECTILKVPKNEESRMEDKHYDVVTSSEVREFAASNGDAVECYGYDVDIDGASFILWPTDLGGSTSVAEEAANAIVESVTSGFSPSGENCYVLTLFADGEAHKYYSTADCEAEAALVKPGDIIQISANVDREISAININFIYADKTITGNATDIQGYNGGRLGFVSGYFYNFSGKNGMIVRHKTIEEIASATEPFAHTEMFPVSLNRGKLYFIKFNRDRKTGEIISAVVQQSTDTSSIESFYSAGTDADYVVQRSRFQDVYYTYIYTN